MCPTYNSYSSGKTKNKNPLSHFTSTIVYPTSISMDPRLLMFWKSRVNHQIHSENPSRKKTLLHPGPQCCIQRGTA